MQLTAEQQHAVEHGEPVSVTLGQTECVVLRKDIYERVRSILYSDGELSDDEAVRLGWEAGRSIGWDTPEMAEYDDYDAYRRSS